MNISQLMTAPAQTCSLDDDLSVPAMLMWANDCGCVPVVDRSGKTVAMITDRDIAMATLLQGRAPHEIRVSDVASKSLVSVQPDDDVGRVEQAMREARVRRVPVVDAEGRPLGVLSLNDLARNLQRGKSNGLSADPIARTLAAICTPRAAPPATTTPQA